MAAHKPGNSSFCSDKHGNMQAVGQHVGVPEASMARRDPFSELMQGSARGMPFPMAAAGAGSAGPVLGNGRLDSEDLQLPDGINVEEAR